MGGNLCLWFALIITHSAPFGKALWRHAELKTAIMFSLCFTNYENEFFPTQTFSVTATPPPPLDVLLTTTITAISFFILKYSREQTNTPELLKQRGTEHITEQPAHILSNDGRFVTANGERMRPDQEGAKTFLQTVKRG